MEDPWNEKLKNAVTAMVAVWLTALWNTAALALHSVLHVAGHRKSSVATATAAVRVKYIEGINITHDWI